MLQNLYDVTNTNITATTILKTKRTIEQKTESLNSPINEKKFGIEIFLKTPNMSRSCLFSILTFANCTNTRGQQIAVY